MWKILRKRTSYSWFSSLLWEEDLLERAPGGRTGKRRGCREAPSFDIMSAAKMWRPFFRAFGIVFAHREYSVGEVKESVIAMRMLGNVGIIAGISYASITLILAGFHVNLPFSDDILTALWNVITLFALSITPLTYGLLGKLLLLPIQSRLEIIAEKALDKLYVSC